MKQVLNIIAVFTAMLMVSCGSSESSDANEFAPPSAEQQAEAIANQDPMDNKGIGPVKSITLDALNEDLATTGQATFDAKCSACHKVDKRYIGPALAGIMERRSPEWVMNMILNPDEMVQNDPIAKQLLMEYSSPMANQSLTEAEAREILEYFRTL